MMFLFAQLNCFFCFTAGRGAESEGNYAAEIPAARRGEHHAGCWQATTGSEEEDARFCHNYRKNCSNETHISFFLFPPLQFKCCGSHNYSDWKDSVWIQKPENKRLVPDSCCKTPSELCGRRDHPSNIYKVEVQELFISSPWLVLFSIQHFYFIFCTLPQGGCIMKLEHFIQSQLYILGAVGVGIAFLQVKL